MVWRVEWLWFIFKNEKYLEENKPKMCSIFLDKIILRDTEVGKQTKKNSILNLWIGRLNWSKFFNVIPTVLGGNFCLFLAALGRHCCAQASFSCHRWGLLSGCGVQASLCCWAWMVVCEGSVVVTHGLSCSIAHGIFLDYRLNLCSLHWLMDS